MSANKLSGAAVVGHSMGGLVGLMLAKAHPGDVGKLMVVDALPYVGDIFVPGATVAQIEPQAKAIRDRLVRSEEHTSELQSLMRNSYAVFCFKKKTPTKHHFYIH